jgi:hypothetical protein
MIMMTMSGYVPQEHQDPVRLIHLRAITVMFLKLRREYHMHIMTSEIWRRIWWHILTGRDHLPWTTTLRFMQRIVAKV